MSTNPFIEIKVPESVSSKSPDTIAHGMYRPSSNFGGIEIYSATGWKDISGDWYYVNKQLASGFELVVSQSILEWIERQAPAHWTSVNDHVVEIDQKLYTVLALTWT